MIPRLLLLLLFVLLAPSSLSSSSRVTIQVPYVEHPYETNQPLLLPSRPDLLGPIRFHISGDEEEVVSANVVEAATEVWSEALSVISVSGPLKLVDIERCGTVSVPESHRREGVPNTDFILYLYSRTDDDNNCHNIQDEACAYDQFHRPIAGATCVSKQQQEDSMESVLQAIGRLLGHSWKSFPYYWDSNTGFPRSPSAAQRPIQEGTCLDYSVFSKESNTWIWKNDTTNNSDDPYVLIVTPTVRTIVQNQFDCPSLEGARLATSWSPDSEAGVCSNDLWSSRFFLDDIMSEAGGGYMTPLTLALFEDSGWYQANWNASSYKISPWGLGAGCDFVNEPCLIAGEEEGEPADEATDTPLPRQEQKQNEGVAIANQQHHSRGYFCISAAHSDQGSNATHNQCSPGLTHKGRCSNGSMATKKRGEVGSTSCPIVSPSATMMDKFDCRNGDNDPGFLNLYREVFWEDSRCIESPSSFGGGAHCYRLICDETERGVKIHVAGEWLSCEDDFQELETSILRGKFRIICPRFSQACPELFSCPFHCRGRGVCSYGDDDGGGGNSRSPFCQCFNTSDPSNDCSNSSPGHPVVGPPSDDPASSTSPPPSPLVTPSTSHHPSSSEPQGLVWPRGIGPVEVAGSSQPPPPSSESSMHWQPSSPIKQNSLSEPHQEGQTDANNIALLNGESSSGGGRSARFLWCRTGIVIVVLVLLPVLQGWLPSTV